MSRHHFIVRERDNAWQYSYQGHGAGPIQSRDEAIAAAIEEARETGEAKGEVIVQDKDLQEETVWRVPGR